MNAPDPAHIDAVARVIDPAAFDVDSIDWLQRAVIEGPALDLLTSTDPAVHAAMLDALTRHGVLTEEQRHGVKFGGRIRRRGSEEMIDDIITQEQSRPDGIAMEKVTERRLATRWEVAR